MKYHKYQNNNPLLDPVLNEGKIIEFCEKISRTKEIKAKKGLPFLPEMRDVSKINLDESKLSSEELKLSAQWSAFLVSNDFKMSSLRRIFEMISEKEIIDVERIQYILAYEVARKRQFKEFGAFLEDLLNKIKENPQKRSKKLKIFLEAVIAYHKLIEEFSKKK